MCCRKDLKVEKHLLVRSKTNWWVHTKNNNTRNEIQLELSFWAHKTCYSGILWFVFCFVCVPVASQKCSALCLNGCLVCNYVDIYGTKQNNKKNLTYRVTWSNLIFIYVSGQRKKKHNLKVLLWETLCVNHTSHRSIQWNASWIYTITHQRDLFWLLVSLLTSAPCS